jgi:hypothetical protein
MKLNTEQLVRIVRPARIVAILDWILIVVLLAGWMLAFFRAIEALDAGDGLSAGVWFIAGMVSFVVVEIRQLAIELRNWRGL